MQLGGMDLYAHGREGCAEGEGGGDGGQSRVGEWVRVCNTTCTESSRAAALQLQHACTTRVRVLGGSLTPLESCLIDARGPDAVFHPHVVFTARLTCTNHVQFRLVQ